MRGGIVKHCKSVESKAKAKHISVVSPVVAGGQRYSGSQTCLTTGLKFSEDDHGSPARDG